MAQPIVLHLVHGTWGRGLAWHLKEGLDNFSATRIIARFIKLGENQKTPWYDRNSAFCRGVAEALADKIPHCEEIQFRSFSWTGSNSFDARQKAAEQFRDYLENALIENPDSKHFIVAHSHGGNVAVDAIRDNFDDKNGKLAGIITLATPFLSLDIEEHNPVSLLIYNLLPVGLILGGAVFSAALLFGGYTDLFCWLLSMVLGVYLTIYYYPNALEKGLNRQRTFCKLLFHFGIFVCWLGACWGGFREVAVDVNVIHPPDSFLGVWERWNPVMMGAGIAFFSLIFLLASQAAGIRDSNDRNVVLADCIKVLGVVLLFTTIITFAYQAIYSGDLTLSLFGVLLLMVPLLTIIVSNWVLDKYPVLIDRVQNLGKLDYIYNRLYCLPCPVVALRLPGDEAALAILASQVVRSVPNTLLKALSQLFESTKIPKAFWIVLAGFLTAIPAICFAIMLEKGEGFRWLDWSIWSVVLLAGVGQTMIGLLYYVLVIVITAALGSYVLLAIAVGPGVLKKMPALRVDCEPLPRCQNMNICRLLIPWEAMAQYKDSGLRHGLYDLPLVQKVVAREIVFILCQRSCSSLVKA
ncbi:triacylglycerol lipase [Desulforhopalus sp. IMCC35007]|uniref:esterase/lipase family protein n=1 Tax=Desulforhopalus sp. IMCC35007 TaxID=2569543 RepID=UPI0010AE9368|nr:hypothetical protein [Desulforhopalus sp. IMCC35007]TKB05689.1 hypothetical protein FCL48_23915 [Desulforhopalus sp. IMCC35007]